MNCQEFDQIVNDLSAANAREVAMRKSAKVHAESCESCARHLANFRALSAGMKALAATVDNQEASPQIEAALLAAFHQQKASSLVTATPSSGNVVTFPVRRYQAKFWALAAAAVLLIAIFALAASHWLKEQSVKQVDLTLLPGSSTMRVPGNDVIKEESAPGNIQSKRNDKGMIKQQKIKPPIELPSKDYSVVASIGELTPILGNQVSKPEITTEFLPLIYESSMQPLESGQVIRVEMPRSALTTFGLPINFERADELVKADVLLAEDGSARAIRFIR